MPQPCKICIHADRQAIDAELLANRDGLRVIGAQYGVSKDSLARHFHIHLQPRQAYEEDVRCQMSDVSSEPRQVSASQAATSEPEPDMDRYHAFIERFRGKRVSRSEVATWGYDPGELEVFIEVALECGDLSRS